MYDFFFNINISNVHKNLKKNIYIYIYNVAISVFFLISYLDI